MDTSEPTTTKWRTPSGWGWTLIFLSMIIGGFLRPSASTPKAQTDVDLGWTLLFFVVTFGVGFVLVPLLARSKTKTSDQDWSMHFWIFAGLAPLAAIVGAFLASVVVSTPAWLYLANAGLPLGVSISLAFRENPLESGRNIA